ncbi:YqiA/YcfP family alpha/beta fold hydrolase [Marinomonas algicola]|uniref:YqiA/YcfP family alpha/beta fold hydrolase n=1 Tax=Marinomonas algicola TaxID=2773454 RepID=UPI0017489101|nr:YqiA/YcfP family alpha/beta fold hydrolase [Marinomonas algicola]
MPYLMYLHGFNSSEHSFKSRCIYDRLHSLGLSESYLMPRLSWEPDQAIAQSSRLIESHLSEGITLIGSSLGGFYAGYLAEKYSINAILVNPAIAAHELLVDYLGKQVNPYTQEEYQLTAEHIAQLQKMDAPATCEERYWLMLQEGDEVLDYRKALQKYPDVRLTLEPLGNHSFVNFERHINTLLTFSNLL